MDRPKRNIIQKKLDLEHETPETPQRLSRQDQNKLNKAAYKARLKANPAAYEAYKQLDAQRARERRQRKKHMMTEEELHQFRENGRARQRAYRERQAQLAKDAGQPHKSKPKTRSNLKKTEELRERNRLSQKKRRENMSAQKKRREKEKNQAYYWRKRAENCHEPQQTYEPQATAQDCGKMTRGAQRMMNCRLRKTFGSGLIVKLKNFVKSVSKSKQHRKELLGAGVQYCSPTKNKVPGPEHVEFPSEQISGKIKTMRSKCVLNAKRKLFNTNINPNLYQKKKSWKTEFAERYFEQKSQHLPCKKTINRHLKQKKILNKSMVNLYKEFIEDHGSLISRATFFRKRPKHVLSFTKTPFKQCLCEVCLNPMLKTKVLNKKLPESQRVHSLKELVHLTVCDVNNLVCVSRECSNCGVWMLDKWKESLNFEDNVVWTRWESIVGVKGSRIDLKRKEGKVEELMAELKMEAVKLPLHDFIQNWQLKQYTRLCASVPDGWAVLTLDFSENYLCEKQDQPQSSYYGYTQVTVHPCVLYYNCSCGDRRTDNITIITDELNHSSALVDRIVQHVLYYLREKLPSLKKVVIFSDGCSSQYKSKIPFAHLTKLGTIFNVERCYFGSRHGKNPCDALGGVLKQAATRAVKARQSIIQNAADLHRFASENLSVETGEETCRHMTRRFWLLEPTEVNEDNPTVTVPIYGTRQLHSLLPTPEGLRVRNLSCFCQHCIEGDFDVCDSGQCVSEWKSVRDWEKLCKNKGKLQKQIVAERSSILNNAFIEDGPVCTLGEADTVFLVDPGVSRTDFLKDALRSMSLCSSFDELEKVVFSLLPHLHNFPIPKDIWPTVFDCGHNVDKTALSLVPKGLEYLYPVCVDVDGNCMPRSLSLSIFSSQDFHEEIRCRICIDSVVNKTHYINLPKGELDMLCTLSECQGATVREVFEKEVMDVVKLGSYMGLWQMMAAATALNVTILSVYPPKGQSCGRFLDRTVTPLSHEQNSPPQRSIVILWTSTRDDMVDEFWVANHVEPMLPLSEPVNISIE